MTDEEINLVKSGFEKIEPVSEYAARLFYAKLFELDPHLQRLFKGDLEQQGRKLMQMIGLAVRNLDRPDALIPAVRALGARHAGYGVENRHYETVAKALLWTLQKALGADFTVRAKEAWAAAYDLLAQTMIDASRHRAENAALV